MFDAGIHLLQLDIALGRFCRRENEQNCRHTDIEADRLPFHRLALARVTHDVQAGVMLFLEPASIRFAPQAPIRNRLGENKDQDGFDAMVFGSL